MKASRYLLVCSRYVVNWDFRESMTDADIEIILERAKELHKEFIRISGMTDVRTSPYYS